MGEERVCFSSVLRRIFGRCFCCGGSSMPQEQRGVVAGGMKSNWRGAERGGIEESTTEGRGAAAAALAEGDTTASEGGPIQPEAKEGGEGVGAREGQIVGGGEGLRNAFGYNNRQDGMMTSSEEHLIRPAKNDTPLRALRQESSAISLSHSCMVLPSFSPLTQNQSQNGRSSIDDPRHMLRTSSRSASPPTSLRLPSHSGTSPASAGFPAAVFNDFFSGAMRRFGSYSRSQSLPILPGPSDRAHVPNGQEAHPPPAWAALLEKGLQKGVDYQPEDKGKAAGTARQLEGGGAPAVGGDDDGPGAQGTPGNNSPAVQPSRKMLLERAQQLSRDGVSYSSSPSFPFTMLNAPGDRSSSSPVHASCPLVAFEPQPENAVTKAGITSTTLPSTLAAPLSNSHLF
eukprot:TRINITY_DN996_c0_g1_i7.p1 TRINITY_DN996_c0_g1~~TRINITY_DN996_c0_g1_i7.p1  ORF type:complete len:399 (+),score=79.72 TRINITY_DN996_c0_g1_i7:2401-3597(+)